MRLTKKQCRELADRITNDEILQMLESAKSNISNWSKPSNNSARISKGKIWNMLAANFDIDYPYSDLAKFKLLLEFGEYIPAHLREYKQPKFKAKEDKQVMHEEPIFENNTDNKESYYSECMKLLNRLLFMKHGPVCEICGGIFENESWLMPIHVLSKGAYKRLQFVLKNIVWGCSECHKDYDEGNGSKKYIIQNKMRVIKNDDDLIDNLKISYKDTPLLKEQNVKESLKQQISKQEAL